MRLTRFETRYWLVRLPPDWLGHHEGIGAALFHRDPPLGVLQITGVPKGPAREKRQVTDDDLLDFALDASPHRPPTSMSVGALTGFFQQRLEGGRRWSHWWLAHGSLMVFATYVVACPERSRGVALRDEDEREAAEADAILASLRPK